MASNGDTLAQNRVTGTAPEAPMGIMRVSVAFLAAVSTCLLSPLADARNSSSTAAILAFAGQ